MQSSTGRWVIGDDFFDRDSELRILEDRVRAGNHTLLTGQRRMGKTSIARQLGRRLEAQNWVYIFTDVEGATCEEDVIAGIAEAVHPVRSIASRIATEAKRWLQNSIEEVSAAEFRIRIRPGLGGGAWRRYGEQLFRACDAHEKRVLLVIDELPIFLMRVLGQDGGAQRVEGFLSWLRGVVLGLGKGSMVLLVSGSIGLEPLVRRLGIPDRINYLDTFRLGPWSRDVSVDCFKRLARSHGLAVEDGVAEAVYDELGTGIPHHVQSFFARLREFSIMSCRDRVTLRDVSEVYRSVLLGPSGQNDLVHYETRLMEALDGESHTLAIEILAQAATQGGFARSARRGLEQLYAAVVDDASSRIAGVLDVLVHDGYLEASEDGYQFQSRLLKDWWSARFRDNFTPIEERGSRYA